MHTISPRAVVLNGAPNEKSGVPQKEHKSVFSFNSQMHNQQRSPVRLMTWLFVTSVYTSGSQTFLHVDPQLKYTIFCRPRGLAQQLLIQGNYVSKYKFEYLLLDMHDKMMHSPKICLEFRGHSVTPIRPRDCLSAPWMVQLTPGGRHRPLWEPLVYTVFLCMRFRLH